ncbi:MAG: ribonuclease P protein component [Proteobacteria bacterium]|nr:ribonuclease P protein component [Pseudomonadota bacterium]
MAYTLTKNERLKKGDFRGIKWTKYGETCHYMFLGKENPYYLKRIAITVRKKTGGAVRRNRMRRLIKEFFRLHKDLFVDCCDNLIRIKKMPQKLTWRDTSEELQKLLSMQIRQ